jgi:hypothetical protein
MAFPQINNTAQLVQNLQQWQKRLNKLAPNIQNPQIPWNFAVKSAQGGNLLTWAKVPVGDGYLISISTSIDFTNANTITLPNRTITSYFDQVATSGGATPSIRYYKIQATNGTIHQPHSVVGNATGVLSSVAIAPNDTATAPSTAQDSTTDQDTQNNTRHGNYNDF